MLCVLLSCVGRFLALQLPSSSWEMHEPVQWRSEGSRSSLVRLAGHFMSVLWRATKGKLLNQVGDMLGVTFCHISSYFILEVLGQGLSAAQ